MYSHGLAVDESVGSMSLETVCLCEGVLAAHGIGVWCFHTGSWRYTCASTGQICGVSGSWSVDGWRSSDWSSVSSRTGWARAVLCAPGPGGADRTEPQRWTSHQHAKPSDLPTAPLCGTERQTHAVQFFIIFISSQCSYTTLNLVILDDSDPDRIMHNLMLL